jgi:hypothetical protein
MWPRAVEAMLGLWLVLSPFLFGHLEAHPELARSDFAAGGAVFVLACLSAFRRLRRAHLGNLLVGAWLSGYGYLAFPHPAPPGAQNELLVGLTLLLFAIAPSRANEPPVAWRRFLEERPARRREREP